MQPFANLFSRLKPTPCSARSGGSRPSANVKARTTGGGSVSGALPVKSKAREAKAAKAKAKAAAEPGLNGNARAGGDTAGMSPDDADMINMFMEKISSFQTMSVSSSEESVFAQWSKEIISSMSETKRDIAAKKKSLKRRKDESVTEVCNALESCSDKLGGYIDVVKKLANANVEGKLVYDAMVAMSDINFDQNIWMRAVRASAFDTLKVARWPDFFAEVWDMSHKHAPDGNAFFVLLASQLLQRLVKALQTNKPFTADTLAYLKGFVDCMVQHADKTVPEGMSLAEHQGILSSVRAVLDFASAPSTVLEAVTSLKDKAHFAAQALGLPQGKKVVEAAMANAEAKSTSCEAMKDVDAADIALTQSGLCVLQAAFSSGLGHCFTAEHGVFVSKTLAAVDPKGTKAFKGLKGADRERHMNVVSKARRAVTSVVVAHVHQELLPFVRQYNQALRGSADIPTDPLLKDTSCLLSLSDRASDVHEEVVRCLKQISELLHDCSSKLGRSEDGSQIDISAGDAAAIKKETLSKFQATTVAFSACVDSLLKGNDVTEQVDISALRNLEAELKEVSDTFIDGVDVRLQHGVSSTVTDAVNSILKVIPNLITDDVKVDFKTFRDDAEQCLLFSTVLPEEGGGQVVQRGIELLLLIANSVEALMVSKAKDESDKDKFATDAKFISACAKLQSADMACLGQLNAFANATLSEQNLNAVIARQEELQKLSATLFDKVAARCREMFAKVTLQASETELAEEILKIEKFTDIVVDRVKHFFPMEMTKTIATQARFLEEGMAFTRECASAMDMDVARLLDLTAYEALYRDAIKWLLLC